MVPMFRPYMSSQIPQRIAEVIAPREDGAVYVGEGARCAELEAALQAPMHTPRKPVLLNSGTSALVLALRLAGARPGSEVIASPVTCLLASDAICMTGARIVWADVDSTTGNLDPHDAARKVTPRTVAILATDWGGRLAEFGALRDLTRGISLIEDAAHAFGLPWTNAMRGDFVTWSFQAIKHFSTVDGGALVPPGEALDADARRLRWAGLDRSRSDSMRCYQSVGVWGYKAQSNDVLAAVGLANLDGLQKRLDAYIANAARLRAAISEIPYVRLARPAMSASWMCPLLVSQPFAFARFMAEQGIEASQVHARNDGQPCFDGVADRVALPGVDEFMAHQTNLPCGWWLTPEDVSTIVHAVQRWSSKPEARW